MLSYKNIQVVDDGGHEVMQAVISIGEIIKLIDSGSLEIGNPRPDHDRLPVGKKGVLRYRKTAQRVKDWADALLRNEAVLGNLTWNFQEGSEWDVDENGSGAYRLEITDGGFATDIDSASRTRAIEMASKANPMTMDLSTRVSVRIFPYERGDDTDRLFWIYNQIGEKVSNTVAKATFQGTPQQRIAKELMLNSPHLGLDNIETKSDVVSKNSTKLVSFGTLSGALEANWSTEALTEVEEKEQVSFLMDFWNALVLTLPDLGRVTLARRQAIRGNSLVATAVAMHGYFAVADALYKEGSRDFSALKGLVSNVTMPADGLAHKAGETVDWFDYDNPEWTSRGVLVNAVGKDGAVKRTLRMSFQTRKAMADAMLERLNLK